MHGSDNDENRRHSVLGKTGVMRQQKIKMVSPESVENCLGLNPFPFKTKSS